MSAVGSDDVVIHHDNGSITFAFKEAIVATFPTAQPPRRLYAERRVVGGVTGDGEQDGGAQPDFSLWRGDGVDETCALVVEVKHYRKAARPRFAKVLGRYARAHPQAEIVLASHGPADEVVVDVGPREAGRCHALGELTALATGQRAALGSLVRQAVGRLPDRRSGKKAALVIDTSGSMYDVLASETFEIWYSQQIDFGVAAVLTGDTGGTTRLPPTAAVDEVLARRGERRTSFMQALNELRSHELIIVATDEEGFGLLEIAPHEVHGVHVGNGLWVATVVAPDSWR